MNDFFQTSAGATYLKNESIFNPSFSDLLLPSLFFLLFKMFDVIFASTAKNERETERQRDRVKERQRDRETKRQRDKETERQRDRETQIGRD